MSAERVAFLVEQIKTANASYYSPDLESHIFDATYDNYVKELKLLDPNNELLVTIGGVEPEPMDELDYWLRMKPLKSIEPIFDEMQAMAWSWTIKVTDYIAMLKGDGFSIRAIYNNEGDLIRGSTRGRNGAKGKDITPQLILTIPTYVADFVGKGLTEVRGEAVLLKEHFLALRERHPDKVFSNQRNSVGYLLKETFDAIDVDDFLTIVMFNYYNEDAPDKLTERLTGLASYGFNTIPYVRVDSERAVRFVNHKGLEFDLETTIEHAHELLYILEGIDERYSYLTDGVVVTVDSVEALENMGGSEKYDEGSRALKFGIWGNKVYTSIIQRIEFSFGTQYITPMAVIKPVLTPSGKVVRRVSLQNIRNMQDYGAYPGRRIFFEYASEINPTLTYQCDDYIESYADDEYGLESEELEFQYEEEENVLYLNKESESIEGLD